MNYVLALTDEQKNIERRKTEPLTIEERLSFFFFPVNPNYRLNPKSANQIEIERFKKFGFEKKIEQAETTQIAGILFYIIIFLIVIILSL